MKLFRCYLFRENNDSSERHFLDDFLLFDLKFQSTKKFQNFLDQDFAKFLKRFFFGKNIFCFPFEKSSIPFLFEVYKTKLNEKIFAVFLKQIRFSSF